MKNLKLLIFGLLLLCPQFVFAQSNIRNPCYTTNGSNCIPDGTSTPHPVQLYSNGVPISISLDGSLSVNTPANPQFTDLFSTTLDTTTNWTTNNSGGTTATSAGSLVISGTTTLSQYAGLATKQSWTPAGISPEIFGVVAIFNTLAVPNTTRIFGVYTSPATPTLAAPITDGYVFRLDASGTLFAEIWSAGVVAVSSNLTTVTGCAPSVTVPNLYYFTYRTNLVQFGCGNNPSAFITFVNPSNQTLPISAYSIAGLTNPSSAATMTLTGLSLSSQSGASVKSAGQAPTVNDSSTVVSISPNSPASSIGGTTSNASDGVATSATNVPTVSYNYLWNGTTWDRLPGTVANGSFMQGSVASGGTDSGNPVKVGGKYNAAGISLANGQRGDLQVGAAGSIKTELWMPGVVASNTIFNNSGDGIPNSATAYITVPLNYMYDGTSWIRSRSIVGSVGAGTGTAAMAVAPTSVASAANTITNASSVALEVARAAKASAGNLYGYYCTAIAGASAGFCIGYNATACPVNSAAVTAALVLDVCAFDTTNKGCSISRIPGPARNYSAGISVCMTTATSPFGTMVSNVDTGFISVDYQ